MFDERLVSLDETFKYYEGMPASRFINEKNYFHWMEKHKMADQIKVKRQQRDLIRDIFVAIDEDGSGTMEIDELIKALLSLCLSQDIDFAKQIVYLFEENLILSESQKDPRMRLLGERIVKSKEERGEISYSFQDFLRMFKTSILGERVMRIIGQEIEVMHSLQALKQKKARAKELAQKA